MLVAQRNKPEMKVKYSRFRHNAKQTIFTSPTGPRRQGGEQEHAQYPTNDDVTSGWSCRRPENVSILSSLLIKLSNFMILLKRCMKEDFPFFLGDRSEISRYCHATWQIQAG